MCCALSSTESPGQGCALDSLPPGHRLPTELVVRIFDLLIADYPAHSRRLALVCKWTREMALPRLLRTVAIGSAELAAFAVYVGRAASIPWREGLVGAHAIVRNVWLPDDGKGFLRVQPSPELRILAACPNVAHLIIADQSLPHLIDRPPLDLRRPPHFCPASVSLQAPPFLSREAQAQAQPPRLLSHKYDWQRHGTLCFTIYRSREPHYDCCAYPGFLHHLATPPPRAHLGGAPAPAAHSLGAHITRLCLVQRGLLLILRDDMYALGRGLPRLTHLAARFSGAEARAAAAGQLDVGALRGLQALVLLFLGADATLANTEDAGPWLREQGAPVAVATIDAYDSGKRQKDGTDGYFVDLADLRKTWQDHTEGGESIWDRAVRQTKEWKSKGQIPPGISL